VVFGASWASVATPALALAYAAWQHHDAAITHRTARDTLDQAAITDLAKQLTTLADNSQEQLQLLRQEMRDDRAATNERLRWLEGHLWEILSKAR
jgi:hypothetical protein